MATTSALETNLYLYGITIAGEGLDLAAPGVDGSTLEPVVEFGLAAIVSRTPLRRIRPQRSNLAAHHQVLRQLAEHGVVLPAAFGTIADSESAIRGILQRNHEAFAGLLQRLRNRVEMGLKIFWDVPNIFEYFVANHQELEAVRDRLFRPGRLTTGEERCELGRLFEQLLRESRRRHTQRVVDVLAPTCVELRAVDAGDERMITKLVCLVDKDRQQEWEDAVHDAARFFDDHYRFDYNGPWPPYNFVNIDLNPA